MISFNKNILNCLSIVIIVLIILYFTGFINKNKLPFEVGESCTYRIHYGPITAGYGRLIIKKLEQHNNIECFYFEGIGKSNSFFDLFFK